MQNSNEIMSTSEAAKFLGVSRQWLEIHRNDDVGPPFSKVGKLYKYRRTSLENWLAANERDLFTGNGAS